MSTLPVSAAVDRRPATMLGLVGVVLVLSMTTWFSATAVLPELQAAFGLSQSGAAWLTNALQLGFVVAALTLSVSGLADSVPAWLLIAGSSALAGLATAATIVAPTAAMLLAARFVTGMALAGVYPPAMKVIASWFKSARGLAMGAAVGALTLGSSGPYLVKALGGRFDWHAVVGVAAAAALIASALALLLAEGPHGGARPRVEWRRIGTVVRDPAVMLANLGYFGHMWELYAMWAWFLAFAGAATKGGALPVAPALLAFFVVAIGMLGCLAGGAFADRLGRARTAAAMMIVSGVCACTIGGTFDGPAWLLVAIALVWGFAIIGDSAQFSALVTELSAPETVGAALSLQIGVGYLLTLVSIRLVSSIADTFGWHWAFVALAPGPFIGAAAMLALDRRLRSPRRRKTTQ